MSAKEAKEKVLAFFDPTKRALALTGRKAREVVAAPSNDLWQKRLDGVSREIVQGHMAPQFKTAYAIAGQNGSIPAGMKSAFQNAYADMQTPVTGFEYFVASTSSFETAQNFLKAIDAIEKAALAGDRIELAKALVRYGKMIKPEMRSMSQNMAVKWRKISGKAYGDLAKSVPPSFELLLQTRMVQDSFTAVDHTIALVGDVVLGQYPELVRQARALQKQVGSMPPEIAKAELRLQKSGNKYVAALEDQDWHNKTLAHQQTHCPDCVPYIDVTNENIGNEVKGRVEDTRKDYARAERLYEAALVAHNAKQHMAHSAAAQALRAPDEILVGATRGIVNNMSFLVDLNGAVLEQYRLAKTGKTPTMVVMPQERLQDSRNRAEQIVRPLKQNNPLLISPDSKN